MAEETQVTESKFHFFGSSVEQWRVETDIWKLIAFFKRYNEEFTLWRLPVPQSTHYNIVLFRPEVQGRVYLGRYSPKSRKRID